MRIAFGLPLRQTEGLIGSVVELLGLDLAVPDHSTLSRREASSSRCRHRAATGGAAASASAETAPIPRDRHLRMIADRGHMLGKKPAGTIFEPDSRPRSAATSG